MGFVDRKKSGNIFGGSRLVVDGQGIYNVKILKFGPERQKSPLEFFRPLVVPQPIPAPLCDFNGIVFMTPTPTPTNTPTPTLTPTLTPTNTVTPTTTPLTCDFTYNVGTITNTPTPTPTITPTITETSTPTPTPTPSCNCTYIDVTVTQEDLNAAVDNTDPLDNNAVYVKYRVCGGGVISARFTVEGIFLNAICGNSGSSPEVSYFANNTQENNESSTAVNNGQCCIPPTSTPTPTPTNTVTPTITPTNTLTPTPTYTPTPTPTPQYRFVPIGLGDSGAYLVDYQDNDSSAYFYGKFTGYSENNVIPAGRIIKLNQDLTIDYSFTGGTGFAGPYPDVYQGESILQQPDGKIIATGLFTSYSGVSKNRIVRLNVDGSIDNTFNVGSGFEGTSVPYTLKCDIDSLGNIYVPGRFFTYNGVTVPMSYLAKLSSGGIMDMSFSATTGFEDCSNIPQCVLVNPDDSMYVTGYFCTFSGISANRIIKLQSNGYKDNSFDYGTGFNAIGDNLVYTFRISGETSFYAVGSNYHNINPLSYPTTGFTIYNGTPVNRILKLNSNGTIDTSFNSGTGFSGGPGFDAFGWSYDGSLESSSRVIWTNKLLIQGTFTSYNGTPSINNIILNSDGTIFQSFGTEYSIMFTIGNKLYGSEPNGYLQLLMTYP